MPEAGSDPDDVRVSDAERQAVVDRLSRATGDGLITLDEFADAAGDAYAAVTRSQLDAVTRDLRLPVVAPPPPPPPAPAPNAGRAPAATAPPGEPLPKRRWVVAIMGGEDRRGRWHLGRRTGAFALMGSVDLDLRDAILEADEIEITAWAIMGGVTVVVPEGIPVESSGFMLMGGRSNRIKEVPPVPGAPLIRVKGFGFWGGIDVRSKPPRDRERADREARREERRERSRSHGHHHSGLPPLPVPPRPPRPPRPSRTSRSTGGATSSPPAAAAGLVTIVCTDIVGSTRYADTLGDQRWRSVLLAHNALVREQLGRHGGTEVKTSGDGFLVTFLSARSALQFAVGVQDALADYRTGHPDTPLELRVGVHAGEVERDGADVVGRNVTVACRLCDAAHPGEVLASAVVADLADSASDLGFGDPRELQLPGIERPVTARPTHRQ
jgi:class 3 adenylate cyclase